MSFFSKAAGRDPLLDRKAVLTGLQLNGHFYNMFDERENVEHLFCRGITE